MRLVLSALIGLLWTLQVQSQELDSPDLLATANIPRLNAEPEAPVTQPSTKTAVVKQSTQAATPTPPPPPAQPVNPGPQVNSKVSLENFAWGADSRYRIQLYVDGKGLQFRGELRADSRTEFTKDRLTIAIRHFPQDFLILTVSVDNDMYAHVFLIEASGASKENPFRILNSRSIRAHKEGVMDEMEGMITGFKKVSGFDVAQSMRKMAEYFDQNPNKKAKDLFDSIEKEEVFVKVLAKPRNTGSGSQVVQNPGALDLRPNTAPPSPDANFQDPQQQEWLRQQRARVKTDRDNQQRRQQQQQGGLVYDPNSGGYYRRQYQSPNYQQGYPQQPPPNYYRQDPFF